MNKVNFRMNLILFFKRYFNRVFLMRIWVYIGEYMEIKISVRGNNNFILV